VLFQVSWVVVSIGCSEVVSIELELKVCVVFRLCKVSTVVSVISWISSIHLIKSVSKQKIVLRMGCVDHQDSMLTIDVV